MSTRAAADSSHRIKKEESTAFLSLNQGFASFLFAARTVASLLAVLIFGSILIAVFLLFLRLVFGARTVLRAFLAANLGVDAFLIAILTTILCAISSSLSFSHNG
jgi:hypothetical protein